MVSRGRDAQSTPLCIRPDGGDGGNPPAAAICLRSIPRRAVVLLVHRPADDLAALRFGYYRLLGGVGQARAIRRPPQFGTARPSADFWRADRAHLHLYRDTD